MTDTYYSALAHPGWIPVLSQPLDKQLLLVVAPHAATSLMLELAARLGAQGRLRVLDGGNRFNVYPVAKGLRRRTAKLDDALRRITVSRAFTCYQLLALLQESPNNAMPTLVLDMLATFMDESVLLPEAQRLLTEGIRHLCRLSRTAPLVVSAKPPPQVAAERYKLLEQLQQAADQCWVLEPVSETRLQPGLWEA